MYFPLLSDVQYSLLQYLLCNLQWISSFFRVSCNSNPLKYFWWISMNIWFDSKAIGFCKKIYLTISYTTIFYITSLLYYFNSISYGYIIPAAVACLPLRTFLKSNTLKYYKEENASQYSRFLTIKNSVVYKDTVINWFYSQMEIKAICVRESNKIPERKGSAWRYPATLHHHLSTFGGA